MLRILILKELRENLFSLRFVILLLVLMALVSAMMVVLTAEYRQQVEDYTRRVELHRRASPATVDRPPPTLASLFRGLTPSAPNQIDLSASAPPAPEQVAGIESTEALFPTIDLSFCIGVVLSLAALLFSYDAITGEKELGTLRQMLANSLPRALILLGKWLAVCGTMIAALLIMLLAAVLLARFLPDSLVALTGSELGALGLIALTSTFYLSAFALMGVFVSALVRRSASALAILMLSWALLIFVWPNVSAYLAIRLTLAPTYQEFARQRNDLDSQLTQQLKERHARGARRVRREKMNREQAQQAYQEIQAAWEREHKTALAQLENDFRAKLRAQERTGSRLVSASPYGSFLYAVTALSDTGLGADDRFLELARLYDRHRSVNSGQAGSVNPFAFEATPLEERFSAASGDMLILVLYNLGLLIAGYAAFRRYDVR